MSAHVSTHAPHARNVRVALTFHYDMQCGYPGPDPLVLRLPGTLPAVVARTAVLLDGKPVPAVHPDRHIVKLEMPPRPVVMCQSIGPGTLTIVFTRAAHVTNPGAGHYRLVATKGALRFSAPVTIG